MLNIDRALILSLFAGYTGKVLILGASPSDAAIILVLAAGSAFHSFYNNKKEITQVNQELTDIKVAVKEHNLVLSEVKTSIASLKISSGMRSVK